MPGRNDIPELSSAQPEYQEHDTSCANITILTAVLLQTEFQFSMGLFDIPGNAMMMRIQQARLHPTYRKGLRSPPARINGDGGCHTHGLHALAVRPSIDRTSAGGAEHCSHGNHCRWPIVSTFSVTGDSNYFCPIIPSATAAVVLVSPGQSTFYSYQNDRLCLTPP